MKDIMGISIVYWREGDEELEIKHGRSEFQLK